MKTKPILTFALVGMLASNGMRAAWAATSAPGTVVVAPVVTPPAAQSAVSSPPIKPVIPSVLPTPAAPAAAPVPIAAPAPPAVPGPATKAPAAIPPQAAPPLPADALSVLRQVRQKLTDPQVKSIRARIKERIAIGDRTFRTDGIYLQGTDLRLRLEFKVVPDAGNNGIEGSFLEVCDGTILWTQHKIRNQARITRRDARQILNAWKSNPTPTLLAVELGLGGLPALLASLERSMDFNSLSEQQINGKKFVVLSGSWNEPTLRGYKSLLGQGKLLDNIPDSVRLYLEPGILFPRRIAFLKQRTPQDEIEPLVQLDFLEIVINGPVEDREFDFVPPKGIRPVDVTNDYLLQLRR